jgi:thiol-disulfide isomerase/thioredoxin
VPCRKTFPFMNELHDELAAEGLHILAVSVDTAPEDAQTFLEQFPADFQVAIDPTPACPTSFEVLGVPSSYVLGRDGTVLHRHTGFSDSAPQELRAQVREALQ